MDVSRNSIESAARFDKCGRLPDRIRQQGGLPSELKIVCRLYVRVESVSYGIRPGLFILVMDINCDYFVIAFLIIPAFSAS